MPKEVKELIQELGETINEHKNAVDNELKAKAKGEDVSHIKSQIEEMDEKLDTLEDIKERLDAVENAKGRTGQTEAEQNTEEHKNAFNEFLVKGDIDGLADLQEKALSIEVDADGGYAVPETLDSEIEKYERESVIMRQECRIITVTAENYRKIVNLGGAGSGWVGETDDRPETNTPKLKEIKPTFGEIYANPAITQKALDDLSNAESWLAEEVAIEFAEQEDVAFTMGDGTNKPKGLFAYDMSAQDDDSRPVGTLQFMLSGADGLLGTDSENAINNLIDLTTEVKTRYLPGSKFMCSRDVIRQLRKLRDADKNMIWQQSLVAGQPSMLLDYSVARNDNMAAAAAGSNSLAFGNFKRAYIILDVRGTRVLRDPFTNKPYVHFYTTKRVGGMQNNSECVKVLRFGA